MRGDDPTNLYHWVGLQEEVEKAVVSVSAAKDLLALAADHFESGAPLPVPLAQHFAAAFRRVVALEPHEDHRVGQVLAEGLHLTAKRRRPKAVKHHLGGRVLRLLLDDPAKFPKQVNACRKVAKDEGVSLTVVQEAWREYKAQHAELVSRLPEIRKLRAGSS